jgi:IclR family transcriptional regulator, KDG regulon repressor
MVTSVHVRERCDPLVNRVKSADRVLDILELLAAEPQGLTLSRISDKLGIARSSVHGLVHTMLQRGYLDHEDASRKTFRLGVRLIQLGLNVGDRLELRTAARPWLKRLVDATHDTALLVVPDRGELLYIDKVVSDVSDIRTDPRASARLPLHCTGVGKALLAALDEASVAAVIGRVGLPRATLLSIADLDTLLADLAATRRRGYSLDQQEAVHGVCCVGAPVRDYTGWPVASISLSTVREFFDPEKTGPQVMQAALEISRAMGWKGSATTLYESVTGALEAVLGPVKSKEKSYVVDAGAGRPSAAQARPDPPLLRR